MRHGVRINEFGPSVRRFRFQTSLASYISPCGLSYILDDTHGRHARLGGPLWTDILSRFWNVTDSPSRVSPSGSNLINNISVRESWTRRWLPTYGPHMLPVGFCTMPFLGTCEVGDMGCC